jgi:hypothetical protein
MKFDIDKIHFGVAVQMHDSRYCTYANASDQMKIWFEDGFFYLDNGKDDIICIVAPNVRQFVKKKVNEQNGNGVSTKLRSVKLDK